MFDRCLQHPDITRAERDGMPEGKTHYCLVCHEEAYQVYKAPNGDVVGCEECVSLVDIEEEEDFYE